MAYLGANDSLAIAEEDSESGFDQIHTDFLQHFKNEIRISGMGNAADDVVAAELEKTSSAKHDEESTEGVHKAQKVRRDSTACDSVHQSDESKLFDAGGGGGDGDGSDSIGCFVSGTASSNAGANLFVFGCMTKSTSEKPDDGSPAITVSAGIRGRAASRHGAIGKVYKKTKEPPLNTSFPSKFGSYELKILKQPEEQHRARYLTEGSRGTVKDQTGQGHPTVKLCGYDQPVPLQVFVGTDIGRMKPHGFYQACKVSNKNSTACVERDIEGTTVIEIMFDPKQEMVAVIDCVGILKLRNADVELRIGLAKSKKKSTCARLIFRVNIPKPDGTFHTLQSASSPIICTQPTGAPEISKKSISQCSVKGGEEMFIIGKNFTKGTVVYFEEVVNDQLTWSKEADIDQDFFQATHLVCTVPSYRLLNTKHPVQVQIVVHSSGRVSDPVCFTYLPGIKTATLPPAESSIPMETEPASAAKSTAKEVSGLKRPYDLSPHSDAGYIRSPGEMTTDMSHLLGHGSATATSAEFCDKEFTDSKIIQHIDPGQSLSTQPLLEPACVIPVMDHLAKSPVDSFILPLAAADTNPGPSVDRVSCFQDSKEAAPFMGVYDGMYDSPVAQNLASEVLSPRSHGDLELTVNQLTNLLEAAHNESILQQTTALRRASMSEQIGVMQSPPADCIAPLLDAVPAGSMEFGEPHSKPMNLYQETRMEDILMELIHAGSERQKMKPKDEMNWSAVPDGNRSFHLTTNSNVASLAGTESHSSCHGSTPSQMENLSSFALKTFEPVQPSSSSVQTPPVLFNFDHSVMQSSFLHSQQSAEVKPDPNFTGIDDFLSGNIRYRNSSSPQSMDMSCPSGMYSDNNHVGLTFTVSSVDHKDDSAPLETDSPKDPNALNKFLIHGSLPGMSSDGNSALGTNGSRVNMISDNCDMVGLDFRNIDRSGFDAMKTGCPELQNILDTRLTNEVHTITDMNPVCCQNVILNHSGVNNSEISLLGVSEMSDTEHRLDHIKQNLHSFSGQDQARLSSQQLFNQSTHSFSDGNKISDYIRLELPELDALICLNATRPSAASSMTSLNDVQMPGTHNQEPIEITPGNCLTELNHSNSHAGQVHPLGNMNPHGNVVATDSNLFTDNGSMQSNLQQSLSELHDLKQQMGFGESQSPTRSGKMSGTQADVGILQESNLSPKAEFSISNEQPTLATSTDPVLMLLSKQDSMQSMCNHDAENFCISEIADIQAQMDCPQIISTGQDLNNTVSLDEILYNLFQDLLASKGENLGVQMVSSSNSSLEAEFNSKMRHSSHSTGTVFDVLVSGDGGYISTDSGMSHDTKTLQQPVAQPLLSQPNSVPVAQPLHSQSAPVHVLLQTQDGKQFMIPITSIMAPPSTTVAQQNQTVEPDSSSMPANVTLMDYKRVVDTTVPASKVVCLPPNLASALTRKLDSGQVGSSTRRVLMVPAGSLNQSGSRVLQVPNERLTANAPISQSSSVDGLYSGSPGNAKFVSALTAVLPQSVDSSTMTVQNRQDHHQPMDTSSPFGHFAQESSGSVAEAQLRPSNQQQNNSSCKMPTLLYQLLTTDDNSRALRGPVMAVTMAGLPNLSFDEVSQVLEMNRKQQGLK